MEQGITEFGNSIQKLVSQVDRTKVLSAVEQLRKAAESQNGLAGIGLKDTYAKIRLHPIGTPYEEGLVDKVKDGELSTSEILGVGRESLVQPDQYSTPSLQIRAFEIALLQEITHPSTSILFKLPMKELSKLCWDVIEESRRKRITGLINTDGNWGVLTNAHVHSDRNLAPINWTKQVRMYTRVATTLPGVFYSVEFISKEGERHGETKELLDIYPEIYPTSFEGWDGWLQDYLTRKILLPLSPSE